MLTADAMNGFKDHVKKTVSHAMYKINSSYYRAEITDIYVDSTGKVAIDFTIDPTMSGTVKIAEVQLYNRSGKLWLTKTENITRKSTQEGVFYRFKFKMSDVIDGAGDSTHPAFIVNGKEVPGIWISKYQNIVNNGRAYSLPGQDPTVNITWDTARGYCESKGKGWHMMTKAEWAAIMLWCKKNGFQPWGNNNYGKDSRETLQQAIPATYGSGTDAGKIYHVLTGTGPLTWSHNKQLDGIWDLNGNVSEWTGALRTVKGELQLLENNNGANSDNPQTATSTAWKAIDATTGAFITPDGNGTTANSIKIDATGAGGAQWCKTITKTSENFSCALGALTCSADISDAAKAVLRAYGLLPVDGAKASDYDDDRLWFNNVADERLFSSGGGYGTGTNAGVGCSHGNWAGRGTVSVYIGFRSAFADLESVGL